MFVPVQKKLSLLFGFTVMKWKVLSWLPCDLDIRRLLFLEQQGATAKPGLRGPRQQMPLHLEYSQVLQNSLERTNAIGPCANWLQRLHTPREVPVPLGPARCRPRFELWTWKPVMTTSTTTRPVEAETAWAPMTSTTTAWAATQTAAITTSTVRASNGAPQPLDVACPRARLAARHGAHSCFAAGAFLGHVVPGTFFIVSGIGPLAMQQASAS